MHSLIKCKFWHCVALVVFSSLLLATDGKVIPGGPFVSIHAEILPVLCCLAVLFFAAQDFRTSSTIRRIGFSILALVSLGNIGLIVWFIMGFCQNRFARGDLVGW